MIISLLVVGRIKRLAHNLAVVAAAAATEKGVESNGGHQGSSHAKSKRKVASFL